MIHEIIPVVAGELGDYLSAKFGLVDVVKIGNITDQGGKLTVEENKIILTLINIERDASMARPGGTARGNPPVNINLYIIISAYFKEYAEGLKHLSGVIGFFQGRNSFDHHNTSELPPHINKTYIEIENLEFRELVNLWGIFGAKYMPSIVYKIRTLNMEEEHITEAIPSIIGITN